MILAGDVGGTNVRLALFAEEGGRLVARREARFSSREFTGLEGPIEKYLSAGEAPTAAGFGVAGPVLHGRAEATNLPWVVDAALLARRLSLPRVALVNDLHANALGLGELEASDFAVINPGEEDPEGNRVLISAGTGLGESVIVRLDGRFRPLASEGGHGSFAPRSADDVDLFRYLAGKFGHVSFERILSGPGLAELYRFERGRSGAPEPDWLTEEIARKGDVAAAVSEAALSGRDSIAERTLDHFVSVYGGEAGNLALKVLPTGGVFIGGGIAPKILPKLLDGAFFGAFCDKGRMGPLLARLPVKVVLNDRCALLGAARAALTG